MFETVDVEEETQTAVEQRNHSIQRQKKPLYEPTFQGGRYKDGAIDMLLNYGDTMGSTGTK